MLFDMSDIVSGLMTGVVSGLVASGIFFLALLLVRPRVKISNEISREGNGLYRVKVVNLTRTMLKNLKYTLQHFEAHGDGTFDVTDISPNKTEEFFIDKYDQNDLDASYAVRFSYKIPDKYLLSTSKLVFIFLADHAHSSTSVCVKKEYFPDQVVDGVFETGKSTKIIRLRPSLIYTGVSSNQEGYTPD